MKTLILHRENILYKEIFVRSCPFSALIIRDGLVEVTPSCRLCGTCVRLAKNGECELVEIDDVTGKELPQEPPALPPSENDRNVRKTLVIHNENIPYKEIFIRCCPFSALMIRDGLVEATPACRLCGVCAKKAKNGECEMIIT